MVYARWRAKEIDQFYRHLIEEQSSNAEDVSILFFLNHFTSGDKIHM